MRIELREQAFDPWDELARHARALPDGRCGATAVFVGTMREFNAGAAVSRMFLEHYPGMTERELQRIVDESIARWSLEDALVIHRVGEILPDDAIVVCAAWSAHRAEALSACRYLIEELKTRAPFWKQESGAAGTRWVEGNTPG